MLLGVSRPIAEDFSFALAVVLTPPVVLKELYRLMKSTTPDVRWSEMVTPGVIGMFFSFFAGYFALRWLSSGLESGRWKYFGFYCIMASCGVFALAWMGL
jgi:undecaprenyl-diphosphatase